MVISKVPRKTKKILENLVSKDKVENLSFFNVFEDSIVVQHIFNYFDEWEKTIKNKEEFENKEEVENIYFSKKYKGFLEFEKPNIINEYSLANNWMINSRNLLKLEGKDFVKEVLYTPNQKGSIIVSEMPAHYTYLEFNKEGDKFDLKSMKKDFGFFKQYRFINFLKKINSVPIFQ